VKRYDLLSLAPLAVRIARTQGPNYASPFAPKWALSTYRG
jgi:hypothetical protein